MKTLDSHPVEIQKTRFVFRVLAGIIGAFLLLVGLPIGIYDLFNNGIWPAGFSVLCSLFAGVGLVIGARTGEWPFALQLRQRRVD